MLVLYTTLVVNSLANIHYSPRCMGAQKATGLLGGMMPCCSGSPRGLRKMQMSQTLPAPTEGLEESLEVLPQGSQKKGQGEQRVAHRPLRMIRIKATDQQDKLHLSR